MGWMPGGGNVLFYSDRELTRGIWRISVADGSPVGPPELLRPDIWQLLPIGFAGDKYFYAVITEASQVHTASLDIDAGRVVTTSTPVADPSQGTSKSGAWSPDGRQLAYLWRGHGDPAWKLAVRSLGGGDTQITGLPFGEVTRLEWVPDSRTMMVFGSQGSREGLFRFDLRSGQAAPVLAGADVPGELRLHASFSPDGMTLYFAREVPAGSDTWKLVARDLERGTEREILDLERSSALASGWDLHIAASPDGRMLALAKQEPESRTFQISVLPTSGGAALEIHRTPNAFKGSSVFCWTPDGQHLLFRGVDDDGNMDLLVIPSDGGEVRRISGVPGFWGFNLHPDGRRFTFDQGGSTKGEIWVIENLP
jgi:Tol biopolymer transport system component